MQICNPPPRRRGKHDRAGMTEQAVGPIDYLAWSCQHAE